MKLKHRLFENKADYEDFVDFAIGTAWVCVIGFVASGIAIMVMVRLGWL